MRIAATITVALAVALIGTSPISVSAQAARILGETDGVTHAESATASSAGPIVSPIHKKTGDLARVARDAAQAATADPAVAASAPTPIPATDLAEPAAGTGGTTAPLGNQPADSLSKPLDSAPTSPPATGATPNPDDAFTAHVKVRKARA